MAPEKPDPSIIKPTSGFDGFYSHDLEESIPDTCHTSQARERSQSPHGINASMIETEIHPDRVLDDIWRESVMFVH
ncbi:MAG: hypothetical protein QGG67_03425 [Gammaproteobacteria bacterium]|jgi:hypothetical protein|nr:hypothetical protein [Gammaproteobacteria bacterium]MDP7456004.1 hypothetical protein [Gammaproteobacteria bacterium]